MVVPADKLTSMPTAANDESGTMEGPRLELDQLLVQLVGRAKT
jgi:hypothetical protein